MSHQDSFDRAFESSEPLEVLRLVLQKLVAEGNDRDKLLEELEWFRQQLRSSGRDEDEDVVLGVMDFLVGWCSSHMKI
jgi:hypothetical protein